MAPHLDDFVTAPTSKKQKTQAGRDIGVVIRSIHHLYRSGASLGTPQRYSYSTRENYIALFDSHPLKGVSKNPFCPAKNPFGRQKKHFLQRCLNRKI